MMAQVISEWGMRGVELLRDRAGVLVIVDVLSFSTAVDVAVSRGAKIYPFPLNDRDAAEAAAERVGAILAKPRHAAGAQYSLSPVSLLSTPADLKLMLPSPNGSRLSLACGGIPVLAGCLRNAEAVAHAAREMAAGGTVGLIPAGERWPDGSLRPAIEDLLGSGAIIHFLGMPCSAEAQLAVNAYRASRDQITSLISNSMSAKELTDRGFPGDLEIALQQNASTCAPVLRDGCYRVF
jgi:2-phosphosulfolactate phosphatase